MSRPVMPCGPIGAQIMVVGECAYQKEVDACTPFAGGHGFELSKMLAEAKIMRSQCFVTLVSRHRPFHDNLDHFLPTKKKDHNASHHLWNGRMVHSSVIEGSELLAREIEMVKPHVIIALGNLPLWVLTGKWGVGDWRGSQLITTLGGGRTKVIPTLAPKSVLTQWSMRGTVVQDLRRAERESHSREYQELKYQLHISSSFQSTLDYLHAILKDADAGPIKIATDIETLGGHIRCIGFARSGVEAMCIPLFVPYHPEGYWSLDEECALIALFIKIFLHLNITHIGQNFVYDSQYIWRWWLVLTRNVRDTMLAAHCAFLELPKSLAYLASVHCEQYVYWKDMYHAVDAKVDE